MTNDEDDRELLARARSGDGAAVEKLLARHERQIYRFGLRMCGHPEDARDVLQETLLAAFRHLHDFRGESSLSTWLYQIARSFCTRQRRPGAGAPPAGTVSVGVDDAGVTALASSDAAPDDRAHARQIGDALSAAIAALPETWREAIVLRDVEGLSAEQAAEVAGVEVGALKSRLHRARMELRTHLATLLETPAGDDSDAPPPCPELSQELAAYAAAEIDQSTCARIEAHLASCTRCRGACDSLRRTVSLCRAIPGDEVPAPVRAAVRRALRGLSA